ncbi:MAG: class I SAM-dependent methyltransferase [Negativicutes bacterium]|nr:class I SAM-dependent methyltransferase [Negativicutes bacterium]
MNYFQELAAKYDAWFDTPHGSYVRRFEHEMIMDLTCAKPGMKILDVGCGTGIYTCELLKQGATVTGIDISPEMLDIARWKTAGYGERVSLIQADAAALPFADNEFDMVVSITAMEFFQNPCACLHEMHRVLRPGGHMVVATLNSKSLWAMQRRIKSWFRRTIFSNANFYSIGDLRRFLQPHTISAWRGGIFVPPFAPSALIKRPDVLERWCQQVMPAYGAFIVVRVEKNPGH